MSQVTPVLASMKQGAITAANTIASTVKATIAKIYHLAIQGLSALKSALSTGSAHLLKLGQALLAKATVLCSTLKAGAIKTAHNVAKAIMTGSVAAKAFYLAHTELFIGAAVGTAITAAVFTVYSALTTHKEAVEATIA